MALLTSPGVADYSHMKGLRIETLDTRMQTLVTFQLNSAYSDARVVSVLTFDNQTAAKIRISLEAFNEKSFIEICEINAYGGRENGNSKITISQCKKITISQCKQNINKVMNQYGLGNGSVSTKCSKYGCHVKQMCQS